MVIATLALCGLGVATYLALYKLGVIGVLSCSVGSCESVQASRWATFVGLPVAVWGVGYYALLFAAAFASTLPRFERIQAMSSLLLGLTAWGALFSGWLTWLELFVIHAICQWCVVSAVIVLLAFAVSVAEWRGMRAGAGAVD